jgi:ketosteroid isomerase-like protein
MHVNQQTLERFYSAFARLDADAMAACYAEEAAFDDEVFSLRGKAQARAAANLGKFLAASSGRSSVERIAAH